MRTLYYFFTGYSLLVLFACNSTSKNSDVDNSQGDFSVIEEGIFVEKFDSSFTDENRYNLDNKVFTVGKKFVFDYSYTDKNGEQFYFEGGRDGWNFVPVNTDRYYVVKTIEIEVLSGLKPMIDQIPEYNQTLLKFTCPPNTDYTISGVVENYRNVWMHPPREALFKILELNPFPFIQEPYEVGKSWDWELDISNEWADPRWATWEGSVTNIYQYEITDKKTISTKLGDLECLIVKASAKSELGTTHLTGAFNTEYGFVDLDFINIDGTKLKLEISEIVSPVGNQEVGSSES